MRFPIQVYDVNDAYYGIGGTGYFFRSVVDFKGLQGINIRTLYSYRLCSGIEGHLWGDVDRTELGKEHIIRMLLLEVTVLG